MDGIEFGGCIFALMSGQQRTGIEMDGISSETEFPGTHGIF